MEKAWEKVWNKACDDALEDDLLGRAVHKVQLDRAVHNSPPPLDDVGSDVSDMLDEKDPTLKLLNERGKTHGRFSEHAEITQYLKEAMRNQPSWVRLNDSQKETLEMIAHKIGRILAGDPDYPDHWDDIAGYAKLVSNQITSRQE